MRIKARELSLTIIIIIYLTLRFFLYDYISYSYIINPLLWFSIFAIAYYFNKDFKLRKRNRYEHTQNIVIIMFIYAIVYFASGLIFGYQNNIYSYSLSGIIKNIMSFVFIIFFQEYSRNVLLIKGPKSYVYRILITFLFILNDTNFSYLISQISMPLSLLEYFVTTFIIVVLHNIVLSFLSYKVGLIASNVYRIVLVILAVFIPLVPHHDWLVSFMLYMALAVVIFYVVLKKEIKDDREITRREEKSVSSKSLVFTVALLIVLSLFVTKVFHYFPVAIISNSMKPTFSRGDVVIVEKRSKDEELELDEIAYFAHKDKMLTHRVIKKKIENNKTYYRTKGDNNEFEDDYWIIEDDVEGSIKFQIPLLGYPSVWLSELLRSKWEH